MLTWKEQCFPMSKQMMMHIRSIMHIVYTRFSLSSYTYTTWFLYQSKLDEGEEAKPSIFTIRLAFPEFIKIAAMAWG